MKRTAASSRFFKTGLVTRFAPLQQISRSSHGILRAPPSTAPAGFARSTATPSFMTWPLRITDSAATIRHVPHILYHSRKDDPGNSAPSSTAGRQALQDAVRRRGLAAEVADGPHPNSYQLCWKPRGTTMASLIIFARGRRSCWHAAFAPLRPAPHNPYAK